MPLTPPILGFSPAVHDRITRHISQDEFACREGCRKILGEVQGLADSRFGHGDKSDGRLYLHFIHPVFGYRLSVHRWVSRQLGIERTRPLATLDDFVKLSELRAFRSITAGIEQTQGHLGNRMAGQILYVLGTLIHAHQDRKHLEGNWTDCRGEGISSPEHFTTEIHQLFSDTNPPSNMEQRAERRTLALLRRFKQFVRQRVGEETATRAFAALRDFRMAPGWEAYHYKPSAAVMNYVFPEYPEADPPPILMGPL